MKIRQVIIVAIILAGGFGLMKFLASKNIEPIKIPTEAVARFVHVKKLTYSHHRSHLTASGRIVPAQSLILSAELNGKLMSGDVPLKQATKFSTGQLLYKISDTEARLQLQSQKSDFALLLAGLLGDIKMDFPDSYPLWEQYFINIDTKKNLPELPEITNRKEKTFLISRKLVSAFYAIRSSEERLSRYAFHAPFDGTFAEVRTEAGTIVNPGTVIGRIIKKGNMEADITMPQEDIQWIKQDEEVKIISKQIHENWKGKIIRVSENIDLTTQSVHVFVAIHAADNAPLLEGAFVEAEFDGPLLKDVFEIPRRALLQDNKVFTVVNDRLKLQTVNILKVNAETVLINGLDAGTLIVIESIANATENMAVKMITDNE